MTPEGKVKKKIVSALKAAGPDVFYFTPIGSGYGRAGIPDIIACIKGEFYGFEVKADAAKNPPTALQLATMAQIERAGGHTYVLDDDNLVVLYNLLTEKGCSPY